VNSLSSGLKNRIGPEKTQLGTYLDTHVRNVIMNWGTEDKTNSKQGLTRVHEEAGQRE
jgi:hypothetical protein